MRLENWDDTAAVTFDRQLWAELCTPRFIRSCHNVLLLGPVGVGKTFLAACLGHIACRNARHETPSATRERPWSAAPGTARLRLAGG
jgi:DNA replication protein DnaC